MKKNNFVPQKELTPIYLDQQGYEELLTSIKELKQRIINNNKGKRDAFTSETNDGCFSSEFVEIERIDYMLHLELQRKNELLSRVVIVEKEENCNKINIGDVVRLSLVYDEDDIEERLFKVVGGMSNFEADAEIQEISINSPMGKAIYKKCVGETCTYSVNNNTINVLIMEKVDLTKNKDAKVKKLTK